MVAVVEPQEWGDIIPPNIRAQRVGDAFVDKSIGDPWLLLEGPPGSGKTSAAYALLYSRYPNLHKTPGDIIYLNAAVHRDVEDVKRAVEGASCYGQNSSGERFLIIDEVDCLLPTAAKRLKGEFEKLGHKIPTILTTNHLTTLDPPLVSRFTVVHWARLTVDQMTRWIECQYFRAGYSLSATDIADILVYGTDYRKVIQNMALL